MKSVGKLLFKGKTAIVTGAGGGLGRAYALEFARRGANVIVNDLGGSVDGSGTSMGPAASVVKEIEQFGGIAFPNNNNVLNGAEIINFAMEKFGNVDILVNNAGILRDKSFHKMTQEEWFKVIDIHLHGTFHLCHSVWPIMQKNNYGKIINVGSASGLYGNFGQANYSAAKMGILGLTNTLAKEGEKHNIAVNCLIPVAGSRMTESLLPPAILEMLEPEHVAPFVAFLAHDTCRFNGSAFEVGGGWYSQVRIQRSAGLGLGKKGHPTTLEEIAENIEGIASFDSPSYPSSVSDALKDIMKTTTGGEETEKKSAIRDSPSPPPSPTPTPSPSPSTSTSTQTTVLSLKSDEYFKSILPILTTNGEALKEKVKVRIRFDLSEDPKKTFGFSSSKETPATKSWVFDSVGPGPARLSLLTDLPDASNWSAYATLTCSDSVFISLTDGSLSSEFAFLTGKLKIDGSMKAALKMKDILDFVKKNK